MLKRLGTECISSPMSLADTTPIFKSDTRGVSEVIGFLLVFAFLIILLSINQAQVVPQENAEIEFKHSEEIQNDLIEVRGSISTAGQADVSQFPTVKLGTNYPARTFALNPPSATGTLQTSESYDITITNGTETVNIPTRFLQYQPDYNELDANPIWYEHSVLYIDARDQGGVATLEDQNIITDGGRVVRITALQNELQTSGAGRVTLELYPTQTTANELPTGELDITLPTRLTGEEYWDAAIDSEVIYEGVTNASEPGNDYEGDGIHALNLNINTSENSQDLQLNTVGIKSEPSGGVKQNVGAGDGDSGESEPTTNDPPTADFTASRSGQSDNVDLDGSPSSDSDGSIVTYEWDIGDDGTIDETGETVKTKIESGTDVTLTVTDDDDATDSITKTVN
jgi:hypothetical protein